jgi:molybdenum cofactor cytidylyltransferase
MGRDKLALPCEQTTVLGYVLQMVLEGIERQGESSKDIEICVVAQRPMEEYLSRETSITFRDKGGIWLLAPHPIPLAETIRMGLSNFKETIQMVGFLPGDQVGVTSNELAGCFGQVLEKTMDFLVPEAKGKVGSPVFFHRQYVSELRLLHGEQGGRTVLHRYPELWTKYPVDESFLQDVDTPEEYREWMLHNESTKINPDL